VAKESFLRNMANIQLISTKHLGTSWVFTLSSVSIHARLKKNPHY